MDAVEYVKALRRLCISQSGCSACKLHGKNGCIVSNMDKEAEKAVKIVEQWAKDHPSKTRKNELLKMFPNADVKIISTFLSPCHLDKKENPQRCAKYGYLSSSCRCIRCRDDYWNEEISDND